MHLAEVGAQARRLDELQRLAVRGEESLEPLEQSFTFSRALALSLTRRANTMPAGRPVESFGRSTTPQPPSSHERRSSRRWKPICVWMPSHCWSAPGPLGTFVLMRPMTAS